MQDEYIEQKNNLTHDLKIMLDDLDQDYPWIVAEMVFLMYERVDKNSPFVKDILQDILKHLTDEEINGVMECTQESDKQKLFTGIIGQRLAHASVQDILSQPAFSMETEQKPYCAPEEDTPIDMGFSSESVKKQMKKMSLQTKLRRNREILQKYQETLQPNADSMKVELVCVATVLEVMKEKETG